MCMKVEAKAVSRKALLLTIFGHNIDATRKEPKYVTSAYMYLLLTSGVARAIDLVGPHLRMCKV